MELCVSCIYLTYCMEYVSVKIFIINRYNYFKELHNEQEYY